MPTLRAVRKYKYMSWSDVDALPNKVLAIGGSLIVPRPGESASLRAKRKPTGVRTHGDLLEGRGKVISGGCFLKTAQNGVA